MYVNCGCNGEKCKVNIAGMIFSFRLEVRPFADCMEGQRFRLTIA